MGRAAKNLKKRGTKVSRPAKDRKHFISKLVADPRVQGVWNHKLTVRQNYARIGVMRATNNISRDMDAGSLASTGDTGAAAAGAAAPAIQWEALPADAEVGPRRGKYYMSEDEQAYMRALIAKYGTNYEAMRRDTKLNWKQHTEGRLERRCERYRLLLEQQAQEAGGAAAPAAGADVFGELEAAHQAAEAAAGAPKAPVAAPAKHAAVAAAPAQAAAAAQPPPTEAKRTTKKAKAKKASA